MWMQNVLSFYPSNSIHQLDDRLGIGIRAIVEDRQLVHRVILQDLERRLLNNFLVPSLTSQKVGGPNDQKQAKQAAHRTNPVTLQTLITPNPQNTPTTSSWPGAKQMMPVGTVACCLCGSRIPPNSASMCTRCLSQQVDLVSELRPASEIVQCSECGRSLFHQRWIALEPESAEMLALMVKKIHGLDGKRLRLVDAKFVWTEPHSRRIKIQVQVEGEALANVTLRQSTVLEFKQNVQQCPLCRKASLDRQWTHCVQIRQRIEEDSGAHRKTFLRIEQDLIKFGLDRHILSVEENNQGMDLFFSGRGDAKVILDWLKSHLPVQMSSQPTKHGSTYTFNVEIPPINKFDLVAFPLGNGLAKLSLISKVSSVLHFVDPITAERMEVTGTDYWKFHSSKSSATTQISKGKAKSKIRSVSSSTGGTSSLAAVSNFSVLSRRKNMTEFVVIEVDSDPVMSRNFKSSSSDPSSKIFYVTLMRDSDFGVNDEVLHTQTHIGSILQPGDSVLGYEIENMILTDAQLESLSGTDLPYVVLVQKIYKEDRDAPDRQPPPLLRRLARPPPSS